MSNWKPARQLVYVVCLFSSIGGISCSSAAIATPTDGNPVSDALAPTSIGEISVTPLPTRPTYNPGDLVEYIAQSGDTLPALAAHFNTSVEEIFAANPILPDDVTTLPPGLPMEIPIYYRPFWGSPYQIIPDSHYVNGPAAAKFDTTTFVNQYSGWIRDHEEYAAEDTRTGAEIIDYVAVNFSVSPRVLLAILELQTNALSSQIKSPETELYPLGYEDVAYQGLYLQLVWAANILNNAYYGWRTGSLISFELPNGQIEQPDPWQNAASVALQAYFNEALPASHYQNVTGPNGFSRLFTSLFGDPWGEEPHIPGSLRQPELRLPFEPNKQWTLTGGPHVGWGAQNGKPLSALDFAPPSEQSGCVISEEWATAVADGIVVRSQRGRLALDLDGDGDERTGWVIFYLHIEARDRAQVGTYLTAGDPVGHPSCEGGFTTGTHAHLARKYNGEWLPAAGALPFVMENWVPQAGNAPYEGSLTRFGRTVIACECSSEENQISSTNP